MADLFGANIPDVNEINPALQELPNLPAPLSAEFLEYRRCVQAHIDACDVLEPDFGTPELEAWDAATKAAGEARHQAARVIREYRYLVSWPHR